MQQLFENWRGYLKEAPGGASRADKAAWMGGDRPYSDPESGRSVSIIDPAEYRQSEEVSEEDLKKGTAIVENIRRNLITSYTSGEGKNKWINHISQLLNQKDFYSYVYFMTNERYGCRIMRDPELLKRLWNREYVRPRREWSDERSAGWIDSLKSECETIHGGTQIFLNKDSKAIYAAIIKPIMQALKKTPVDFRSQNEVDDDANNHQLPSVGDQLGVYGWCTTTSLEKSKIWVTTRILTDPGTLRSTVLHEFEHAISSFWRYAMRDFLFSERFGYLFERVFLSASPEDMSSYITDQEWTGNHRKAEEQYQNFFELAESQKKLISSFTKGLKPGADYERYEDDPEEIRAFFKELTSADEALITSKEIDLFCKWRVESKKEWLGPAAKGILKKLIQISPRWRGLESNWLVAKYLNCDAPRYGVARDINRLAKLDPNKLKKRREAPPEESFETGATAMAEGNKLQKLFESWRKYIK